MNPKNGMLFVFLFWSLLAASTKAEPKTLNVCITGAAGQISYSLIPLICSGRTFGDNVRINLKLLDLPQTIGIMEGVKMEIEDSAFPLLNSVEYGDDPFEMLKNAEVAIFVGGFPRSYGMERKDLIQKNSDIFKTLGLVMNVVASKDWKVLVVANPANTNCLILSKYASSIPKENFSALTRLDHDRALAQIALRLNQTVNNVKDVIVWGNHSPTQYPDVRFVKVKNKPLNHESDKTFYQTEFIKKVQLRGAEIINARSLSSSMSAANAVKNHIRDWYLGSDDIVSMALISDGTKYGIEKDLWYSFPVKWKGNFKHEIVSGLEIDFFSKTKMEDSMAELIEERNQVTFDEID